jgi:hypothetical protein
LPRPDEARKEKPLQSCDCRGLDLGGTGGSHSVKTMPPNSNQQSTKNLWLQALTKNLSTNKVQPSVLSPSSNNGQKHGHFLGLHLVKSVYQIAP